MNIKCILEKLYIEHWLAIAGFILALLFALSVNNVFPASVITSILSSQYCILVAGFLIALGYFISKVETEDEYRPSDNIAPGLGEKKSIMSDKPVDSDFGGGGGD